MVTALAGGIGAAKFLRGLARLLPPRELTVVGNTGDDIRLHGLRICPDLDTVMYTLSGRVNSGTGWGVEGDTFRCLEELARLGEEAWFQLGDRDLAVHLFRTEKLNQGWSLTRVTEALCEANGLSFRLLPMCEGYHPTLVETDRGRLHLQEYLVRERCRPRVCGFVYQDLEQARLEEDVRTALADSRAVLMCPSNPFISLGPILAVPGMRETLAGAGPVVAITPIIGDRAVKGPAAKMLAERGHPVSALGVAQLYQGLADRFVLDHRDAELAGKIESLGMEVLLLDTLMVDLPASQRLAADILESL